MMLGMKFHLIEFTAIAYTSILSYVEISANEDASSISVTVVSEDTSCEIEEIHTWFGAESPSERGAPGHYHATVISL